MKKEFEKIAHQFEKIDQRFDVFATIVKRGFDDVGKRLTFVEDRVDAMDKNIGARLLTIERDIAEIRAHFVYREEFEDLMARMKYVEKKLNIKSGK